MKTTTIATAACFFLVAPLVYCNGEVPVFVENPSFEDGTNGWTEDGRSRVEEKYVFAAPDGKAYARLKANASLRQQRLTTIEDDDTTYTATVYARSLNPLGSTKTSTAKLSLLVGTREIRSIISDVNPTTPKGAGGGTPNDDGGNVFFDGNYRVQASEVVMYQTKDKDPQLDAWKVSVEVEEPANYAPGCIHTPEGLKALYATAAADGLPVADRCVEACDDCEAEGDCPTAVLPEGCECEATIIPVLLQGQVPEYGFLPDPRGPVLKHSAMKKTNVFTSYFPSPGDASLFYDDNTGRLWMVWGGWTIYVTELDPSTGRMLGDPDDVEVDHCIDSTPSCAVAVLSFAGSENEGGKGNIPSDWNGDEWSAASYVEGPALYKHEGYWYAMGSYGDLDRDYTIRVCRNSASNPNEGTFYDKDGLDCTVFDESTNRYGCSMLLGPDGVQAVPGHPHIWREEDGRFFLGYDFRYNYDGVQGASDFFGLRQLYWVGGWPTIWKPLTISFNSANLEPGSIGSSLSLKLENVGSGIVGFDHVTVTKSSVCKDNKGKFKVDGVKRKKKCGWVGKKRKKRCKKTSEGTKLSGICPKACRQCANA